MEESPMGICITIIQSQCSIVISLYGTLLSQVCHSSEPPSIVYCLGQIIIVKSRTNERSHRKGCLVLQSMEVLLYLTTRKQKQATANGSSGDTQLSCESN
eukprot:scaffold15979_cov77-Skeletonema_marinoi.AAC.4